MKELKDTIEMMQSADYKERFVAEYLQVKIRYEKLTDMCARYEAGVLDFTPTCPLQLLKNQAHYMFMYKTCLETRAEYEGIDLREYEDLC